MPSVPLTKIIATLSPLTDSEEIVKGLIKEGVRIFRINFSHGTQEEHATTIGNLRKYSKDMGVEIAICLDTRGPELRIEIANTSEIPVKTGDTVIFSNIRKANGIFLDISDFSEISQGSKIFLDDGMLGIEVVSTTKNQCEGRVLNTHRLKNNKKASFPGTVFKSSISTKQDREDIEFGVANSIDVIFASFINGKEEVEDIRRWIGNKDCLVFSKVETLRGYHNIDEIIEASDGIMIARGDLCVELDTSNMFSAQKTISEKCLRANKPCICATQMLETMITNVKPSRSEITDIGNAVLDQCDALLLSGETAIGNHPVLTAKYMRKIILNAEDYFYKVNMPHHRCPLLATETQNACVVVKTSSEKVIKFIYNKHLILPVCIVSDEEKFLSKIILYRGMIPHKTKELNMLNIIDDIKNLYSFEKIIYVEIVNNDKLSVKRVELY